MSRIIQPMELAPGVYLLSPDTPDTVQTTSKQLAPGVFELDARGSMSYLVTGARAGLVIDSGFYDIDLLASARRVTGLPLSLVNTHGHCDHTGGNSLFDKIYAHPLERPNMPCGFIPVEEGHSFDLGGRRIEVLETPGHTPGSISLLDRQGRMIFTGDLVYRGTQFMQFAESDLSVLVKSLDRLLGLSGAVDSIFCGHGPYVPCSFEHVEKVRALAAALSGGGRVESYPVCIIAGDHEAVMTLNLLDGAAMYFG